VHLQATNFLVDRVQIYIYLVVTHEYVCLSNIKELTKISYRFLIHIFAIQNKKTENSKLNGAHILAITDTYNI
jgi:hypothetical protein